MFKSRRGKIRASFGEEEADLLRRLINDYVGMLDSGDSSGDPVLDRLFPPVSVDETVDQEWREMASDDLSIHKRGTADTALSCLGPSGPWEGDISDDQREAWLVLLTDLRLAIGTRLGVTEETMSAPVDPDDPDQWPLAVLHYLGVVQENLVTLSGKLP